METSFPSYLYELTTCVQFSVVYPAALTDILCSWEPPPPPLSPLRKAHLVSFLQSWVKWKAAPVRTEPAAFCLRNRVAVIRFLGSQQTNEVELLREVLDQ